MVAGQFPEPSNKRAPRCLQLRQSRLDHVSLLTPLEMLATLSNPLLALQDQVRKLVADLQSQKFQQGQTEQQVDLDIFLVFRFGQRTLQHFRQQSPECRGVHRLGATQLDSRQVGSAGILPHQIKQVIPRHLRKFRAQVNVVVNVVHADGQVPHGQRRPIGPDSKPVRLGCGLIR